MTQSMPSASLSKGDVIVELNGTPVPADAKQTAAMIVDASASERTLTIDRNVKGDLPVRYSEAMASYAAMIEASHEPASTVHGVQWQESFHAKTPGMVMAGAAGALLGGGVRF